VPNWWLTLLAAARVRLQDVDRSGQNLHSIFDARLHARARRRRGEREGKKVVSRVRWARQLLSFQRRKMEWDELSHGGGGRRRRRRTVGSHEKQIKGDWTIGNKLHFMYASPCCRWGVVGQRTFYAHLSHRMEISFLFGHSLRFWFLLFAESSLSVSA
jgi:hypothetical protein